MMIAWRDHLVGHGSLEAAYLAIVRRNIHFPRILVGQLVQVILRNALDGCEDVFALRAAEMFFRPQKLVVQGTSIIAVDEETDTAFVQHSPSPLLALLGVPVATEFNILSEATAASYWEQSDRFDMALDLSPSERGMAALGDVIARWLAHLLAIDVVVEPVAGLQNLQWSWYVGLTSEATYIGDAIWRGDDLADAVRARLIGVLRLAFLHQDLRCGTDCLPLFPGLIDERFRFDVELLRLFDDRMCLMEQINQCPGCRQRLLNLLKLRFAKTGNVTNDIKEQVFQHSVTLPAATR